MGASPKGWQMSAVEDREVDRAGEVSGGAGRERGMVVYVAWGLLDEEGGWAGISRRVRRRYWFWSRRSDGRPSTTLEPGFWARERAVDRYGRPGFRHPPAVAFVSASLVRRVRSLGPAGLSMTVRRPRRWPNSPPAGLTTVGLPGGEGRELRGRCRDLGRVAPARGLDERPRNRSGVRAGLVPADWLKAG
jgi:hypothetical protein